MTSSKVPSKPLVTQTSMKRTIFLTGIFLLLIYNGFTQEQSFMTSDSVNLFVKVKGNSNGIPCLYIHGGPGAGSYWMEKFSGDILEKRFKMIYLDLRGVGRSTSPANKDYSMNRMIQDFEEIRKHLGIRSWLIMGHSFSGTITTAYAYENPNSINGIMMFNCTLNIEESITTSWIPYARKVLGITDTGYYHDASVSFHDKINRIFPLLNKAGISWKMAFSSKESEDKMNATFGEIPNWNRDFAGIGLSHKDYLSNFKVYTKQIKKPVLFFYGKTDWTVGPKHYKNINFPNMLLWGGDVGHIPFLDNKPEVEKAIDGYLKKYKMLR